MAEYKLDIMIQQAIDGTLPEKERARLDKLLSQDPKLRQHLSKMEKVAGLLNQMDSVDPPKQLKQNILSRIDRDKYLLKPEISNRLPFWPEWLFKPKPKIALAFCSGMIFSGLLLILLLSAWFTKFSLPYFNLIGTIGISDQLVIEQLYDLPLNSGTAGGRIKVNRFGQLLWLELNFPSGTEVQITLEYDPRILRFDQALLLQSTETSIRTLAKQIIVAGRPGGRVVTFFVKTKPSATIIETTLWSGQIKSIIQKIELN